MIINIINLSTDQPATSVHPSNKKEYIRHSREERVLNVCKQSKEQGFAVRFWEGIIEPNGVGINKAFKKIVRWAKEQGLKMVCIGEDDLIFLHPEHGSTTLTTCQMTLIFIQAVFIQGK